MADLKRWSQGELTRMRKDVDRLFDDLCTDFDLPAMFCRIGNDLNLSEEGDYLVARLELGNIHPDDVSVSVLDRRLLIKAETVTELGNHKKTHTFRKEIRLPCTIKTNEVRAEFRSGLLEIRLPKCPVQPAQSIAIIKK